FHLLVSGPPDPDRAFESFHKAGAGEHRVDEQLLLCCRRFALELEKSETSPTPLPNRGEGVSLALPSTVRLFEQTVARIVNARLRSLAHWPATALVRQYAPIHVRFLDTNTVAARPAPLLKSPQSASCSWWHKLHGSVPPEEPRPNGALEGV